VVRVLLFGRLRDVAGWREKAFEPSPPTLLVLRELLIAGDAILGAALAARGVRIAVDREIVTGDMVLSAGAEVAFMPAMSGG